MKHWLDVILASAIFFSGFILSNFNFPLEVEHFSSSNPVKKSVQFSSVWITIFCSSFQLESISEQKWFLSGVQANVRYKCSPFGQFLHSSSKTTSYFTTGKMVSWLFKHLMITYPTYITMEFAAAHEQILLLMWIMADRHVFLWETKFWRISKLYCLVTVL